MTQDTIILQGLIDEAIKTNGIVKIERSYTIDVPLVACKWDEVNGKYQPFTIQIIGRSTMWDVGGISQITYTGKDGFALGIQLGKGCVIKGVNFQGAYRSPNITSQDFFQSEFSTYGDTTCRDSRYSPYAGIVIDPFRPTVPDDGGYPGLTEYYRGQGSGGSTGFTIDNCTVNNFTTCIVFSPNGLTANCELMTVSNIRIYNSKAGFVGCQAQEKSNLLTNINCWGRTHTLFVWGEYGNGTPGMYNIDRVQIAGGVVQMVHRNSGGYFPLTVSNVFAELLGSIGQWQSLVGDKLSNSIIGFAPPETTGAFPSYGHTYGQANNAGILLDGCTIRYYGKPNMPVLLNGEYKQNNCTFDQPPMWGYKSSDVKPGYAMYYAGYTTTGVLTDPLPPGSIVAYCNPGSWIWEGLGVIGADGVTIQYSSKNIIPGKNYGVRIYKKL